MRFLKLFALLTLAPAAGFAGPYTPLDLVILFDGSGSIAPADFDRQKNAVQSIVNGLPVSPTETRVALVDFGTNALMRLPLSGDPAQIAAALDATFQVQGETNHAAAFSLAGTVLDTYGRSGATGAVLLITDGSPNRPFVNPAGSAIAASQALRSSGYYVFGVGVGPLVFQQTLNDYASAPTGQFVHQFSDFTTFSAGAASTIVPSILQVVTPPPSGVPETQSVVVLLLAAAGGLGAVARFRRARA